MSDTNTGNRNAGNRNAGHYNTGNWNTGHRNTGDRNTGHRNTGDRNTGDRNTGDRNTGHQNTGNWNTGDWNTGDRNTGYWNTGDWNTGFFNTTTPEKVRVFDGSEVDRQAFLDACPTWLFTPAPTTWVSEREMTDQEKIDNPTFHTCGGYLRTNDWGEAWRKAYEQASAEDVQKVRDLPGFNAEVFLKITGLDLRKSKDSKPLEVMIDGVAYVRKDAA